MAKDYSALASQFGGSVQSAPSAPQLTGEDYLKTVPEGMAPIIKDYASGKLPMSPMMVRSPAGISLLGAISQYDPSFDATNYNARNKLRSDFTAGKASQNLNAFNTVLGHLGQLQGSFQDLNNTRFPAINAIKNWVESATGAAAPNNFDLNKKAVVDELTRAWRGSGGSEGDIQSWSAVLNNSQSPEQFKGALEKATGLLQSKIDAMKNQYTTGMGNQSQVGAPQWLSPDAQKTLTNLEDGAPVTSPTSQNIRTYNPKTGKIE